MTATKLLHTLFDLDQLEQMVTDKYVRVQSHPFLPLSIANYTERAQYDRVWNPVTLTCRGLIYDEFGRVVARPFAKFFNYGDDANTGPIDFLEPTYCTDKLDGSLGIVYPTPQGPAIATRGSFNSEQALHATRVLRTRYDGWRPPEGVTALFEIVYPANRIVVDYGDLDDLVLLAVLDIDTGRDACPPDAIDWPGPVTKVMPYPNLHAAIQAPPRPGQEGMVATFGDGRRVKLKQDDYVALHRIVTNLNERTVWEHLGTGATVADLCITIPDDFHGWVEDVGRRLRDDHTKIMADAWMAYDGIVAHLDTAAGPRNWARRDFAHLAQQRPELAAYLFLILDGKYTQADDMAWRSVKPSGARSMVNHDEAVA